MIYPLSARRICRELICKELSAEATNPEISDFSKNSFMKDPAEQLQRLYQAGFDLQTFPRFPKAIGIIRNDCMAFVTAEAEGLRVLGNVGWRMGESLGPLVDRGDKKVFVHKDEVLEATPERVLLLQRFREDLNRILAAEPEPTAP